jgi:hypothetical protein
LFVFGCAVRYPVRGCLLCRNPASCSRSASSRSSWRPATTAFSKSKCWISRGSCPQLWMTAWPRAKAKRDSCAFTVLTFLSRVPVAASAAFPQFHFSASPSTAKRPLELHFFDHCRNRHKPRGPHSVMFPICVPRILAFRLGTSHDTTLGGREPADIRGAPSQSMVLAPHGGQKCTKQYLSLAADRVYRPHTNSDDETRTHNAVGRKVVSRMK